MVRQAISGGGECCSAAAASRELGAPLVTQGVYAGDTPALTALNRRVVGTKSGTTIERVKVWSEQGVILYSDDPRMIGLRYPLGPARSRMLTTQEVGSAVTDQSGPENVLDRVLGRTLDVYAGARDTTGRPILVETYFNGDRLDADQAALTRRITAVVLIPLLVLGLLFLPLAYSLARRMSRVSETPFAGPDDTR
jgi:hypothetical protein